MTEPDEIQYACIGCRTYNPASAEVCAGCGHRFAGPDVVSPVQVALPLRASDNPYEAPLARISSRPTFRIGSLLIWIAVIAVCLGAFRENFGLGVLAVFSIVPASIRTSIRAGILRTQGREIEFDERIATFLITLAATWAIFFASVIAFFGTCFPVGLATNSIGFALVLGIVAAIACAVWLTRVFLNASKENARRENEIRYR